MKYFAIAAIVAALPIAFSMSCVFCRDGLLVEVWLRGHAHIMVGGGTQ